MRIDAGRAYSKRAVEYANLFGSMGAAHPSDRQLVDTWADAITGPVMDAGCGPGHWTNYLLQRGAVASGVDLSPDFIAHARAQYSGVSFEVGDFDAFDIRTGALGGLLSWYSLIHPEPRSIHYPSPSSLASFDLAAAFSSASSRARRSRSSITRCSMPTSGR